VFGNRLDPNKNGFWLLRWATAKHFPKKLKRTRDVLFTEKRVILVSRGSMSGSVPTWAVQRLFIGKRDTLIMIIKRLNAVANENVNIHVYSNLCKLMLS